MTKASNVYSVRYIIEKMICNINITFVGYDMIFDGISTNFKECIDKNHQNALLAFCLELHRIQFYSALFCSASGMSETREACPVVAG